jgi:hypothetical protein
VLWAKSIGGSSDEEGLNIFTDVSGNILVTGYFKSPTITFGTTTLNNTDNSGNTKDIFLVKYDSSGNVLWTKKIGGASNEQGQGVTTDINGNICIAGYFTSSSLAFGNIILNTGGGYSDFFVAKYDILGNILWAKSGGAVGYYDFAYSISTDINSNIVITGSFVGTANFGSTTLTSVGLEDFFILKYDSSGNMLWVKSAGGNSWDVGQSVSTDPSGNILVTGYFKSDTFTFGTTALINKDNLFTDIFLVKYDSSGNIMWAKSAGGNSFDQGESVSCDANGNVLITGYFKSDTIVFGNTMLINNNINQWSEIFIVKYNTSGNIVWATGAGGISDDEGHSISTDINGNVLITGMFTSNTISFGTTTLNSANSGGYANVFLAKMGSSSTGIEQVLERQDSNCNIYPNPNTGKFSIKFNVSPTFGEIAIEVLNILGEKVYSEKISSNGSSSFSTETDLSNQPNGIYSVRISSEKENIIKKISITK